MNSRQQGSVALGRAIAYFSSLGFPVLIPISEQQRYDLIVDMNDTLYRVECKHGTQKNNTSSYKVDLRTQGGNRSGRGKISVISSTECDLVFILANNETWLIPSKEIEGMATVTVGGDKWDEYKCEGAASMARRASL